MPRPRFLRVVADAGFVGCPEQRARIFCLRGVEKSLSPSEVPFSRLIEACALDYTANPFSGRTEKCNQIRLKFPGIFLLT